MSILPTAKPSFVFMKHVNVSKVTYNKVVDNDGNVKRGVGGALPNNLVPLQNVHVQFNPRSRNDDAGTNDREWDVRLYSTVDLQLYPEIHYIMISEPTDGNLPESMPNIYPQVYEIIDYNHIAAQEGRVYRYFLRRKR